MRMMSIPRYKIILRESVRSYMFSAASAVEKVIPRIGRDMINLYSGVSSPVKAVAKSILRNREKRAIADAYLINKGASAPASAESWVEALTNPDTPKALSVIRGTKPTGRFLVVGDKGREAIEDTLGRAKELVKNAELKRMANPRKSDEEYLGYVRAQKKLFDRKTKAQNEQAVYEIKVIDRGGGIRQGTAKPTEGRETWVHTLGNPPKREVAYEGVTRDSHKLPKQDMRLLLPKTREELEKAKFKQSLTRPPEREYKQDPDLMLPKYPASTSSVKGVVTSNHYQSAGYPEKLSVAEQKAIENQAIPVRDRNDARSIEKMIKLKIDPNKPREAQKAKEEAEEAVWPLIAGGLGITGTGIGGGYLISRGSDKK